MKRVIYAWAFLLLLACGKEKQDNRLDVIDQFMQGQAAYFKFNGNVLVAEKGKVIYQKSFGVRNFYTQEPLNDTTVFELASVSKQFTAMGILLLEKQGKLKLTDSLRSYFPELPYSNISVHHLLTHTSGLPDYESAMYAKWDHKKIAFNSDMIRFLSQEKPLAHFKPGTKWEYSNTGYAILASIIEKVAGTTYKDFLAANIFEPLGMKHTRVYNSRRSGERLENYAYGFVWSDSLKQQVLPDSLPDYNFVYFLDGIQGDGVVNSTTGDLLKWDRGLANKTLIGDATTTKMIFPQALSDTIANLHYGYGVIVGKNELGNFVSHSGGWPGYATNLSRYTDDDRTIIILSNNESPSSAIQAALSHIMAGHSVEMPTQHQYVKQDTTVLDKFVGSFTLKGRDFDLTRKGDTIVQVFSSGQQSKFIPQSDSKVFSADGLDVQLEVVPNNNELKYYRVFFGVKQELVKRKK
ncbi:MAG: beta-lactamase family protein [Bacteroidetes bacterium]|nr:beta-lactamase family protein [Bacteroidota bacterium]